MRNKNKKIKIIYIISDINKALCFEWVAKNLNSDKYELSFVLLNMRERSALSMFLDSEGLRNKTIRLCAKKDYFRVFLELLSVLIWERPQIIHTHLFDASLLGLAAGWVARVPKRVYTRHYSTYHHMYHPRTVRLDRLMNQFATDIVAVSSTVKNVLTEREGVSPDKISKIPHGFDLDFFENVPKERIIKLRKKYAIDKDAYPIVGVISRFDELKGIQYIIPAYKRFVKEFPKALLLMANAMGDYKEEIDLMLSDLSEDNYKQIAFEEDLPALYGMFDIFVHTPIDSEIEAFGQTYVEALASGIPSVFTISGIAKEFIKDGQNALIVAHKDSGQIYEAILRLLKDKDLRCSLTSGGKSSVTAYDLDTYIASLEDLYSTTKEVKR